MVKVGEVVPDFEADAYFPEKDDIGKLKFSDYKGKWVVLAFYPADFTFVCPTELEELADYYEEFKKEGAEVISVSTDTAYVHKAWHDASPGIKKIKYPMLADPAGKVSRLFGTYIEDEGVSWRATFIIDPDGKVVHMEMHDLSIGRSAKEILRRLRASKYVREHPGMVCPASWEPGKEALEVSLELVGKI
ncbi:alkyl hydroperoxide reductase [Thermococcus celericrescens]|uniref:Alkyl hydroperoxide reductase n=1 Tax=Thermococcus celericrescens TaxID=227598 RepID=A0A100XZA8_9EURY|nr:peroxiredoxin [Thermococcus celericrescens]KUH34528.1 alkyl hydroperoxide reductase [Thermococcus celericrescens]